MAAAQGRGAPADAQSPPNSSTVTGAGSWTALPSHQERGATHQAGESETDLGQPGSPDGRVVRILNGPHTGAETTLRAERLLIGNLETECDVVLDVGRTERHACLIRVSADGWTVLAIAGDLWVIDEFVAPQETREIGSGTVLTLGRIALCVAELASIDWESVRVPVELQRPEPGGPVPSATILPNRSGVRRRWHALRTTAGLGLGALVLGSAATYLRQAWEHRVPTAASTALQLQDERSAVAALPFGSEVKIEPAADVPTRVLVTGYLPKRADAQALAAAIRAAGGEPELRVQAVDELSTDLGRRFGTADAHAVEYGRSGRFTVTTNSEHIDEHDRAARMALQEVPGIEGLRLRVEDVHDDAGGSVIVKYERAKDRPGDLIVADLDKARQRLRYGIREVRIGAASSIVLDNGARYFEGALLPDGATLKSIGTDALVIEQAQAESRIALPATASVDRAAARVDADTATHALTIPTQASTRRRTR